MRRLWQLIQARWLYWRLRRRQQTEGVTVGLLLQTGRILDYSERAQMLYLAAGRTHHEADMAYYEGQRKLIDWILRGSKHESFPTRPRDEDGPGTHDA